jgi:hypothetical protein
MYSFGGPGAIDFTRTKISKSRMDGEELSRSPSQYTSNSFLKAPTRKSLLNELSKNKKTLDKQSKMMKLESNLLDKNSPQVKYNKES